MRGAKLILLGILLGVPTGLAATQVHAFRGEPAPCEIPGRECSVEHNGALQIECQGSTCAFILSMNATYQASVAQTSKVLRAYGRDWTGQQTAYACETRASSLTVRCTGIVQTTLSLPNASPCRTFEAIADAIEQPVGASSVAILGEIGLRHTSTSTMQVCRNGLGTVTITNA